MGIGIYINVKIYTLKTLGQPCSVTDENILFSFIMYGSYFMFFCHFFYLAYLKKTTKKLSDCKAKHTNGHSTHMTNGKSKNE
jgi:elongation of very long chain fatty acids protein 6